MNNSFVCALIVCTLSVVTIGCMNTATPVMQHAVADEICVLQDAESSMGFPLSMDIVNDTSFVVTDGVNVFLYSMDGKFIRKIGAPGNARNEYNRPSSVKASGDSIYVWSSMTLSFLSYDTEGNAGSVYVYPSAVCDFLPMNSCFAVYAAGVRGNNILEIVPKDGSDPIGVQEASDTHKLLCSNASSVPLFCRGDRVFFSSKDCLDIISYDMDNKQFEPVHQFESASFKLEPLPAELKQMDRKTRSAYLKRNPMVILLFPDSGDSFNVMTLEGETIPTDDGVSNENRYFAIYSSGRKDTVSYYDLASFGYWHLFSFRNGSLFFIDHSISGNDDRYCLKKVSF